MSDDVVIKDAVLANQFVATDEIAGRHFQIIKLAFGADGVANLIDAANRLPVEIPVSDADYQPGYSSPTAASGAFSTDPSGNLLTRGQILTDEGTFRINFANASLAVQVAPAATLSGGVFTGITAGVDLHVGDYIRFDADTADTAWAQVIWLSGNTAEVESYSGGSTSGAVSRALVAPFTGTGGSISVASGQLTITSGIVSGSRTGVRRHVDYAPLVFRARLSLSQRVANQDFILGLAESQTGPRWFARFRFNGATNTVVICETGRNPTSAPSAAETEQTTVTIPATSALQEFRVEVLTEVVRFFVGTNLLAEHSRVIPSQHDEMDAFAYWDNTGVTTTSSAVLDYITVKNHNKIEIGVLSDAEQIAVRAAASPVITFDVTGTVAINTTLVQLNCSQYQGISIHCHSIGTSGVITPEWSADNANWTTATVTTVAGANATTLAGTTNYVFPRAACYFRLRMSTAANTTRTLVHVQGMSFPVVPWRATQPVSGTVTATVTSTRVTPNAADGHSSTQHTISAASTNDTLTRNAAAAIGLIVVTNSNVAARYFKLYNKASAPTSGDTPIMTVLLPPNSTTVIGGNSPIRCSTGIGWRLTTGIAVADTGAVGAAEHAVSIFYT